GYTNNFTDCQIINNNSSNEGGGYYAYSKPTIMTRCTISGNTSVKNGAGILLNCSGMNPFTDCTITNNTISAGTSSYYGAGIDLQGSGDGIGVTLRHCTISSNQNLSNGGDGGGISIGYNWGSSIFVNILDSTISGNTTNDNGAGIRCVNGSGYLAIRNTTITNNSGNQGDGIWHSTGTIDMLNTIVYGNGNEDLRGNYRRIENCLYGTTAGFSVTTSVNNIIGQDPLLGPLDYNGGNTFTHLPASNSPAINAGTATTIVTLDDKYGQLVDCGSISGIVVGTNTDANGFLYASVVDAGGGSYRVNLYKDSARSQRVAYSATYTQYAGEQTLALSPDNSSGIGGSIKVNSTTPTVSNLRIYVRLYDQRGLGFPAKVGSATDIGSVEYDIPTYKVTYDGNGNTGGTPPNDTNRYQANA
ncbi:MAG: choice-of-anchor Q domain-containing protein, partial [Candidatus Nanoarchaeia archaeon]